MNKMISRRQCLVSLGFAAATACTRNKAGGFSGYAIVANAGDNSLAAINLSTFRLEKTISLQTAPSRLIQTTSQDSPHSLYALLPQTGSIAALGPDLDLAQTRRLADHLSQLALAGDGRSLVALSPDAQLFQIDLATLEIRRKFKLSLAANRLDFSVNGYAAAASAAGGVELLDLGSGRREKIATPPLGDIRFRHDGKVLLAANLQNRSLLALDVPSLQTVAELPLAMRPDNLCFSADQGQLFVSGDGMDGVAVVFPFNTLVDQTILAGHDPGPMACSASPAYLFVASETGSDVCILNIETRKVIGFVETGARPTFVTITPDSRYALVLDRQAGAMGVIRIPIRLTGTERRLKTAASLFTMISVGSQPVDAAIIARDAPSLV